MSPWHSIRTELAGAGRSLRYDLARRARTQLAHNQQAHNQQAHNQQAHNQQAHNQLDHDQQHHARARLGRIVRPPIGRSALVALTLVAAVGSYLTGLSALGPLLADTLIGRPPSPSVGGPDPQSAGSGPVRPGSVSEPSPGPNRLPPAGSISAPPTAGQPAYTARLGPGTRRPHTSRARVVSRPSPSAVPPPAAAPRRTQRAIIRRPIETTRDPRCPCPPRPMPTPTPRPSSNPSSSTPAPQPGSTGPELPSAGPERPKFNVFGAPESSSLTSPPTHPPIGSTPTR